MRSEEEIRAELYAWLKAMKVAQARNQRGLYEYRRLVVNTLEWVLGERESIDWSREDEGT